MIKVLVSSCEYGEFEFNGHSDETKQHQGYEIRSIVHTDKESMLSRSSMHPRMYGKINKMMNWFLYPGYDYYVWRDSRIMFISNDHIVDLVSSLEKDVGFFKHRVRSSIVDEFNFIDERKNDKYLSDRYSINVMKSQVNHYINNGFEDNIGLFECGLFVFSKDLVKDKVNNLMRFWMSETMMWSENDQISLPYCLSVLKINPHLFTGSVLDNKWVTSNYKGYS